CASRSWDGAYW
nr:immunoglobulin heavy chain junction region [Mus musculus]